MFGYPARFNKHLLAVVLGLFVSAAAFGHGGSRVAAISSVPPSAERNDADQEVLKANEECNTAELHGDVSAMDKCETDDFTHTHANGTVERKFEYLKGVGSGAHKFLLLDLSELHVRSYGDSSAIVEGNMHLRADNSGKIADVNNRFMTVWVKLQGKWREAAWIAVRVPANAASENR